MFMFILQAIENFALAIIVGGGIVMAAAVRPLLSAKLAISTGSDVAPVFEEISINAWNRYNRLALLSAAALLIVDVIRVLTRLSSAYWHLVLAFLMLAALIGKLAVDKQLKQRLNTYAADAVGSKEQNAGHRLVERLTKLILVIALLLVVLPE
ncbi:hypothetical protein [Paenibacillus woosongensis]|uniref:DUF4149 domain-containing protein n=1 Tax=Paenibacillus woosongensis TaxID=307580 RepID=A0ABQ4MY25_9BACL|nr:hypothetical protein [Paenibacillus woosongensis]GIP60832.1 hypothetical protein J15TS10_46460 [Paenibacillus woosongensis]